MEISLNPWSSEYQISFFCFLKTLFLCFLLCFFPSSLCFCFIKTAFSAPVLSSKSTCQPLLLGVLLSKPLCLAFSHLFPLFSLAVLKPKLLSWSGFSVGKGCWFVLWFWVSRHLVWVRPRSWFAGVGSGMRRDCFVGFWFVIWVEQWRWSLCWRRRSRVSAAVTVGLMGFSGVLMSEIPCKLYFCFCVCLCFLTPCLVGEKRKERLWVLLFSLLLWFPPRKTSTQRKPCSSILLLVSVELEVVVFFRFFLFSCIFSETNRTIMVCSFATLIISMFFGLFWVQICFKIWFFF